MGPVVASIPVALPWLWHDHADEGRSATVQPVWLQGGVVTYSGIDRCDQCGRPLEQGQWLVGLCKRCEQETSDTTRHQRSGTSSVQGRKGISDRVLGQRQR